MIVTLLVSTGAAWESEALRALTADPGIAVLKRCVDIDDLLAAASTGQAEVAVVGAEVTGLDVTIVEDLRSYGVRLVAVTADLDRSRAAAARIGIDALVHVDRTGDLLEAVRSPTDAAVIEPHASELPTTSGQPPTSGLVEPMIGRVIAVWGAGGAPGRTTVSAALAAEFARRSLTTLLIDADPYGGAVAQQLGVLDEVSGLLAAARLAAAGTLAERFTTVQRRLSDRLRVITGLPRPDRWIELRPGALSQILDCARREAQVVIDTGFSIEQDPLGDGSRPERNGLTLEALTEADEVIVVGSADPVGLARLARGLAELHESVPGVVARLVVNRMRPTLGWRESDVVAMLAGFGPHRGVHFLPDDQPAVDRALVAGRTLIESGESPLTRAVGDLLDAMAGRAAAQVRR